MNLDEEIWRRAVVDLEMELQRACPTLVGGIKSDESIEGYASRCVCSIGAAVSRLRTAREKLTEITGGDS